MWKVLRSGAQWGTRPHRMASRRMAPLRWRTAYTGSVGATFQLGERGSPTVSPAGSNSA